MTFLDDAGPVIVPFLAALLVPRLPTWALPCAIAAGAAGFVLSLQSLIPAVAVMGAASNLVLVVFSIYDMAQRFLSASKRRLFNP